jgi:hypothetical protein
MSLAKTVAPSRANSYVTARPMPRAAPVTSTTLFFSLMSISIVKVTSGHFPDLCPQVSLVNILSDVNIAR